MKRFVYACALCCLPIGANAATIDFEDVVSANLPFVEQGIEFSAPEGFAGFVTGGPGSEGQALVCNDENFGNCVFVLEAASGSVFDLTSLSVFSAALSASITVDAVVTGVFDNGTSAQITASTAAEFFATYVSVTPGWTDLVRVEVASFAPANVGPVVFGIDNIVVSVVPLPAAVWLFGSAIFGLGLLRRAR